MEPIKNVNVLSLVGKGAGTFYSDQYANLHYKGIRLFGNVTDATNLTTLTINLQIYDELSATYIDMTGAVFVAWSGTGSKMMTIYPGLTAAANTVVANHLGKKWRLKYIIVGTGAAINFTVNANYLG